MVFGKIKLSHVYTDKGFCDLVSDGWKVGTLEVMTISDPTLRPGMGSFKLFQKMLWGGRREKGGVAYHERMSYFPKILVI